mmetsp:Transcript_75283/g.174528  ORF Transcript_75283/g.174528 Transcript_75283/m.174528 type:complete len:258 (+) Transcript_75283:141-914(+)
MADEPLSKDDAFATSECRGGLWQGLQQAPQKPRSNLWPWGERNHTKCGRRGHSAPPHSAQKPTGAPPHAETSAAQNGQQALQVGGHSFPPLPHAFFISTTGVVGRCSPAESPPPLKSALASGSFHERTPNITSTTVTTMPRMRGMRPMYQLCQSALPSINGAMSSATMAISFSKISNDGPDVSLKGSPTVSPTTHALPWSVFLSWSFSHSFFELSQAPPALPIITAIIAALPIVPASRPMTARGPTMKPTTKGESTA